MTDLSDDTRSSHELQVQPADQTRGSVEETGVSFVELLKARVADNDFEFSSLQFPKTELKIHRLPAVLMGIDNRYIVPMLVPIGPYHRASPHLQAPGDGDGEGEARRCQPFCDGHSDTHTRGLMAHNELMNGLKHEGDHVSEASLIDRNRQKRSRGDRVQKCEN